MHLYCTIDQDIYALLNDSLLQDLVYECGYNTECNYIEM